MNNSVIIIGINLTMNTMLNIITTMINITSITTTVIPSRNVNNYYYYYHYYPYQYCEWYSGVTIT